MKRFRDLKREARAALKGKWGEAALTMFAYLAIVMVVEWTLGLFMGFDSEFIHRYQAYILQGNPHAALSFMSLYFSRYAGVSAVIAYFLIGPLVIGLFCTFLYLLRGDKNLVDNMFKLGFRPYWRSVMGYFLMAIKVLLWTLLLIIPGAIKILAYSLTPYILKDNPELSCLQAIERSRLMMKGNKWRMFVLILSFIGWFLLGIITLGIGFFWIAPYMYTTMGAFYEDVKAQYELEQA